MDTPAIRRKTPAPYRRVFFYVIVKGEKNLSYHNVRQYEGDMWEIITAVVVAVCIMAVAACLIHAIMGCE